MKSPEEKLLPYTLSYLIPLLVIVGINMGDIWTYLPVVFLFGALPFLERFTKPDTSNPNKYEETQWGNHFGSSFLLLGHIFAQLIVIVTFFLFLMEFEPTIVEIIGATLSVGIMMGAIGITVAHELIHRSEKTEQILGNFLLLTANHLHFSVEHILGHHNVVGTESDTGTAKIGESFYRFLLRNIFGSYIKAWNLESQRLHNAGVEVVSFQNRMVTYSFVAVFYNFILLLLLDAENFLWYLLANLIASLLLAAASYINHYGLFRHEGEDGIIENIEARHSWSSSYKISRWFLFELPRHADHHLNPTRPFQILRHIESSPQHPSGYFTMILMALIPPIWFKNMDAKALSVVSVKTDEVLSITPPTGKNIDDFLD